MKFLQGWKVEWRSALVSSGELSIMMAGMMQLQMLFVDNLVSVIPVGINELSSYLYRLTGCIRK